jgi:two-component sensor histidine kinase
VQAIARQTTISVGSIADYAERLCKRVHGLARTHDLIIADDWEGVTLGDLIGRQVEPFQRFLRGIDIATELHNAARA